MLKKIFITFLVFLTTYSYSFASGENCAIKDSPSKDLLEYIKNNRQIIINITKEISLSDNTPEKSRKKQFVGMFNEIINWNGYTSYFKYYITFPISNDVTYETKRDYSLLENEGAGLISYLKTITKKGYDSFYIENACKGITTNCDLKGSAGYIVGQLIKNQSNVIDIYRNVVMGNDINLEDINSLILVKSNFTDNLYNDYGPGSGCSSVKGSFFSRIKEKITSIELLNEEGKKGAKEWIDAWDLLMGNKSNEEYQKIEEELLMEELGRQGISGSKAEAFRQNLRDFNNKGFNLNNNFLTNSFKYFSNNITEQIKKFDKDVLSEFRKKENLETKTINSLLTDDEKSKLDTQIAESISEVYNKEIPFLAVGNGNIKNIMTDLVNLHNNLNNSINTLKNTCEIAVKVCKKQNGSLGYCGSCN